MKAEHGRGFIAHRTLLQRRNAAALLRRAVGILFVFAIGTLFGFYFAGRKQLQPNAETGVSVAVDETTVPRVEAPPSSDFFQFRKSCAPALDHKEVLPAVVRHVHNGTSPYEGFPAAYAAAVLRDLPARGWGSKAPVFEELIRLVRPKTIIEVGTFLGASALHMAELTRRLGLPSSAILCLDDFRGWPAFRNQSGGVFRKIGDVNGDVMLMQQFMKNVVDAGEEGRVVPVPFSTASGLAALCELGVYGDLVEVDAGHDFHSAWSDINMAWKVVRPGGVLFGHDYNSAADRRGVRRAVNLFAATKGLQVKPNGQHWVLFPRKAPPAAGGGGGVERVF